MSEASTTEADTASKSAVVYPAIADLVPHGPPMLMLDALVNWSPGLAECRLTVSAETPFVTDNAVGASLTLEFMAQAVAACLGYEAYQGGAGVRVGMIIGVRQMTMAVESIAVGTTLSVFAKRLRGNETLSRFEGEVIDQATRASLATASMTLYHAEKPPDA
ncbi:MAG: putative hotdog family 3-hydroxylacyl-ACP dehydratase [Myxococcota bacterium]|jgi:predicted hotdog family 3-hydroxylacyl-ACP dehydratase